MTQPDRSTLQSGQGSVRYLLAFRERWLLIATLVIVAVLGAALYSYTAAKQYKSGASLVVNPMTTSDPTLIGTGVLTESNSEVRAALTVSQLIPTQETAVRAKQILATKLGPAALLGMISIDPIGQSNTVTIVATANSPALAANVANAFANAIVDLQTDLVHSKASLYISSLQQQLAVIPVADRASSPAAQTIEGDLVTLRTLAREPDPTLAVQIAAVPPTSPSWPRPKLSIAVAFLAALVLGMGLALALEFLAPDVKDEEELLFDQRLPILARVPRLKTADVRAYLAGTKALPVNAWEAYRTLRASLSSAGKEGGFPAVVLVTSAAPAEGKTMTAMNLAITLVRTGMRVVLIDGDLRRPMVASAFGVAANRRGLAKLLTGGDNPTSLFVPAPGFETNLLLLIARPEDASVVDLLEPRRLATVMEQLHKHADVVIIDSPPFTEAADAIAFAEVAEVTLITVRFGRTRRDKLNDLCRALLQRGVSPAGFVVTTRRRPRASAGSYEYTAPPLERPPGVRRRETATRQSRRPSGKAGQLDY